MKKILCIAVLFFIALGINGCSSKKINSQVNTESREKTESTADIIVTNHLPFKLKSVSMGYTDRLGEEMNLVSGKMHLEESCKFQISDEDKISYSISLIPEDGYTVSEEFTDTITENTIIEISLELDNNEVKIVKESSEK